MTAIAEFRRVGVVGCGCVGTALGLLLARAEWVGELRAFSRSAESARRAVECWGRGEAGVSAAALLGASDLILVAVPDDALEEVAAELGASGDFRGKLVFHTSGAKPSAALEPLARRGARIGSLHPLQTFPEATAAAERFAGSYCAVESADTATAALLSELAAALGGIPFALAAENKALYHAAACVACNYLTALLDASAQLFAAAGVEEAAALRMVRPLVEQTLRNNLERGPVGSLTGPIARGDGGTVAAQLAALEGCDGELGAAYKTLGVLAARLAERQETITAEQREALVQLLRGD